MAFSIKSASSLLKVPTKSNAETFFFGSEDLLTIFSTSDRISSSSVFKTA